MNGKTLIAYVTKGGVTEEAAHAITEVLRDQYGLEVDLVNLKKDSSPNLARASGVRGGKVYKEALGLGKKAQQ